MLCLESPFLCLVAQLMVREVVSRDIVCHDLAVNASNLVKKYASLTRILVSCMVLANHEFSGSIPLFLQLSQKQRGDIIAKSESVSALKAL